MIKPIEPHQAANMAELHQRAITPAWPKEDMDTHIQQDICLGYDDPLSGFIIIRHTIDQSEILTIVTDPELRQQGIARKLLHTGEQAVRKLGSDIIFLEVAEDNLAAIALYKASAYKPFGRRPAYYRRENGRIAALTFRKRLDA